jgi:hypothetical protein
MIVKVFGFSKGKFFVEKINKQTKEKYKRSIYS